jgi:Predicted metal-binding integral membrane protein (DUF2182)
VTASTQGLRGFGEPRLRAIDWGHPEWWVVPIVGAAWLGLAVATLLRSAPGGPAAGGGYTTLFVCPIVGPGTIAPDGYATLAFSVLASVAMVVAMMGLLVLPLLHHVGLTGVWARRRRGPAFVIAGFVLTWLPVVWVLDLGISLVAGAAGALVAVGLAVAVAVVWQVTPRKARAIRACRRSQPLAPRGRRADLACLRFGSLIGRSCVVECSGFMLVAAAAGHGLLAMAALAIVQLHERTARRPRPLPGVLASLAVGGVAAIGIVLGG